MSLKKGLLVTLISMSFVCFCLKTPGLWIDETAELGSPHQRSASWGSADHLKEVFSSFLTVQLFGPLLMLTTNTSLCSHSWVKKTFLSFLRFFIYLKCVFICQSLRSA